MLNKNLRKCLYTLLGVALTILISGDIKDRKYLQGMAKLVLVSYIALAINKDRREIAKLTKEIIKTKRSQVDLEKQLNQFQERVKTDCDRQIKPIENRIQSIQERLDCPLTKVETPLKPKAATNKISPNKSTSKPKPKPKPKSMAKPVLVSDRERIPKTVVSIDEANYYKGCEDLGIEPDYLGLKRELTPATGNLEIYIYMGVFKPRNRRQQTLIRQLNSWGYRVIELPINTKEGENSQIKGDDTSLACDLVEKVCTQEITAEDKVILVTGDGDYFPALEKIKQRNIHITLVSSNPSRHLNGYVDRYLDLNLVEYDICQHQKTNDVA